jgi:hypothetical protein
MKNLTRLFILTFLITLSQSTWGQNNTKFHVELDYSYQLGLGEHLHDYDYHFSGSLGGHALTVNMLYNITPALTTGIGIGLSRYTSEYYSDDNTMPLYASLRYRPIRSCRSFYTYTDIGYALLGDGKNSDNSNFTGGMLWNFGAGYQLMFHRHFGLNFKIGYNLQQFRNQGIITVSSNTTGDNYNSGVIWRSLWRHSIQLGFGFIF